MTVGNQADDALLRVEDLAVEFSVRAGRYGERSATIRPVDGVDLTIGRGETLALAGESGSGKSTTGFAVVQRYPAARGRILFDGQDVAGLKRKDRRRFQREVQMVFQDPYASLNLRMTVKDSIAEPLRAHGLAKDDAALERRVAELLELCGMPASAMRLYPHAFSGGQRQRIGIARALALNPRLLIADEAVSALDVSVQAQIVNLLQQIQREMGLSILFISHNLAVVRHIAHRIAVMYSGRIVETATSDALFESPRHPYTQALLSAIPSPDPGSEHKRQRIVLSGDMPSLLTPPTGCRFHTRCWLAVDRCRTEVPPMVPTSPAQDAACWETDRAARDWNGPDHKLDSAATPPVPAEEVAL